MSQLQRRMRRARHLAGAAAAVAGRPGPGRDPPTHRTSCKRPGRPAAPIVASSADRRGSAIAGSSRSPGRIRSRPRAPRRVRVRAHGRLRTATGARRPRDAADTSKRRVRTLDNRFALIEARHGVFRSEVAVFVVPPRTIACALPCSAHRWHGSLGLGRDPSLLPVPGEDERRRCSERPCDGSSNRRQASPRWSMPRGR